MPAWWLSKDREGKASRASHGQSRSPTTQVKAALQQDKLWMCRCFKFGSSSALVSVVAVTVPYTHPLVRFAVSFACLQVAACVPVLLRSTPSTRESQEEAGGLRLVKFFCQEDPRMKEPQQVSPVSCSLQSDLRSDVFCLCWITRDPTCFRELGSVSEYPQRIGALL